MYYGIIIVTFKITCVHNLLSLAGTVAFYNLGLPELCKSMPLCRVSQHRRKVSDNGMTKQTGETLNALHGETKDDQRTVAGVHETNKLLTVILWSKLPT